MIDVSKPFCLYANCEVTYDGRASSVLENGNYLIIYKYDGSVQIHGATKIQPRNYQSSGSSIQLNGNILTFRNKKENIFVTINEIMFVNYLKDISDTEVKLTKTESDLVDKLFNNLSDYIDRNFIIVEREYQTEYGPIDLIGFTDDGEKHAVEVKRGKATIADCTQLKRYVEALGDDVFGYLASPDICKNAVAYLDKNRIRWIKVDF